MMHAFYTLHDYPVLAALAAERTQASRLDGRACRAIYDAALPGVWQNVSDHEREFMRQIGVAGMKAHLSLNAGGLIAQLEIGGRIVAGNAHKMAEQLRLAGVTADSLTATDWKTDPDHAPTSGQIIAIKAALRGLPPKTAEILLFLDFDGCLHSNEVFLQPCSPEEVSVDERRFVTKYNQLVTGKNLFEHCDRLVAALEPFPNVQIVISSTWRGHFDLDALKAFLPSALAGRVIGVTPGVFSRDGANHRLREIGAFSSKNQEYANTPWMALDDNLEYPDQLGEEWALKHLLLLDGKKGFTDADAVTLRQRLQNLAEGN